MMSTVLEYRVSQVEKDVDEQEKRLRAVELFQAKIIGWSAGAAFAGGAAIQLVQWLINR